MAREMKDSGIEWIGEIPVHWAIIKLKNTHDGMNVGESIDKEYWEESDGDKVFYTAGLNPITTSYQRFPPEKYTEENDLLLARNGTPYVYLPKKDSVYTDHIIRVRIKANYSKKYIMYCLQRSIDSEIVDTVSIATWSASIWNRQFLPLPSLDEQSHIASFLDTKCAEIDKAIEATKSSIEEYKKLRQAIITKAVTKGLDPNVEMKDSGVEWIGEIPFHWNARPIKNSFTIVSGSTPNSDKSEYWDGDIPWITPADFKTLDKITSGGSRFITKEGYNSCSTNMIPKGSIIFSKRAPIGSVVINSVDLCTNQGCLSCIKNEKTDSTYFYYVMSIFVDVFNLYGSGTTFKEISATAFGDVILPLPPILEQKHIASLLDTKCSEIDSLIKSKEKLIEELTAYRKSLIFEYVTGKKEVPAV